MACTLALGQLELLPIARQQVEELAAVVVPVEEAGVIAQAVSVRANLSLNVMSFTPTCAG